MATRIANGLDLLNQRIQNVGNPSVDADAANKSYVDASIRGLDWKGSVRVAASGNISVASPGGTIDGVTMVNGDRVGLLGQTAQAENGPYTWNGATTPMTRTADADSSAEVTAGLAFFVSEGTANGDKNFILTTNDPITLGTTALVFSQLGGGGTAYTAGNGISLSGNAITAVAKTSGGLGVDTGGIFADATLPRKFSANIGNGSLTTISVTHNLGTLDFGLTLVEVATGAEWLADITSRTTTTVTLAFATAPATNAFRVTVMG